MSIPFQKIINLEEYKIILTSQNLESFLISIQSNISNEIYELLINQIFLSSYNSMKTTNSIKETIEFISNLINNNNFEIEKNGEKLNLFLDSEKIELFLNKTKKTKKETNIDEFHFFRKKSKIKLGLYNSIKAHSDWIRYISIFPSGNLISVSNDKSIKIYDIYFNVLQIIKKAHNDYIFYLDIKDENNFITCSFDKNIKIWIKELKEKQFILKHKINNAHNGYIYKVLYYLNDKIISCSNDETIKIWEKNNNNEYQLISSLKQFDTIRSILILEDKNILISSGGEGTRFWNINNYECIIYIKNAFCANNNALKRINDDKLIVGGRNDGAMKIISISEKKIIKSIENEFLCCGICIIENKNILIIGGESKDMKIYNINTFEYIQTIKEAHIDWIYGISKINKDSIITYGCDGIIKVWIL